MVRRRVSDWSVQQLYRPPTTIIISRQLPCAANKDTVRRELVLCRRTHCLELTLIDWLLTYRKWHIYNSKKNHERWYYLSSTSPISTLIFNITAHDFFLLYMCPFLYVSVNTFINHSFMHLYLLFYYFITYFSAFHTTRITPLTGKYFIPRHEEARQSMYKMRKALRRYDGVVKKC